MADSITLTSEGDCLRLDDRAYLMVCLCDLSAEDMLLHLAGVLVSNCAEHKAVKLESMLKLGVAIGFTHVDEQGDYHCISLEEARARL